MVKQKGYRYRLKPTTKQRQYLNQAFGCARKLYNFYVDDLYRQLEARGYESGRIDNVSVKEASAVKKLFPYMKDADSLAYANVKQNFTKAINNFNNKHGSTYRKQSRKWVKTKGHVLTFRDLKGLPSFKSKKQGDFSFTTNNQKGTVKLFSDLKDRKTYIKIPKLKTPIRIVMHRAPIAGSVIKSATISMDILGNYDISILLEYDDAPVMPFIMSTSSIVGLDYAQQDFYVDSEGETANYPHFYRQQEDRLVKEQRKLSRKQFKSANWIKQKKKVSRLQYKIKRQRLDWLHKKAYRLAEDCDAVVVEDLDLRSLAQCLNLGKNLHDNGFGMFRNMLAYKLEDRGKVLVKLDKWFPSSKTCSDCGAMHEHLKLIDRIFACPECGLIIGRDHNAAINIRQQGIVMLLSIV